jgi:hypothetical protein
MGLAWYHVEIGKGIPFETLTSKGLPLSDNISIGNLALNHIRFTILEELPSFKFDLLSGLCVNKKSRQEISSLMK